MTLPSQPYNGVTSSQERKVARKKALQVEEEAQQTRTLAKVHISSVFNRI